MLLVTCFFFFNDTATTEIYTLSLHDALPISRAGTRAGARRRASWLSSAASINRARPVRPEAPSPRPARCRTRRSPVRSEEHTSELQSRQYLVCRLLLEKKTTPCRTKHRLLPQ